MKKLIILSLTVIAMLAFTPMTEPVKSTIKVYGNCGQCKERIETALDQKGIKSAEWDIESKVLTVIYNPDKIDLKQIHQYIQAVGHDTEGGKGVDSVYQKLPDCCLYRENPNTHHD